MSACLPNFLITEYFVNLEPIGNTIARKPIKVADGHIAVGEEPGLGIELDEAAMAKHPYAEFPVRRMRRLHGEEG